MKGKVIEKTFIISMVSIILSAMVLGWNIYEFHAEQAQKHWEPSVVPQYIEEIRIQPYHGEYAPDLQLILHVVSPNDAFLTVKNVSFTPYTSNISVERHQQLEGITIKLEEQLCVLSPKTSFTHTIPIPLSLNVTKDLSELTFGDILGEIQVKVSLKDAVTGRVIEKEFTTTVKQLAWHPTLPVP